MRIASWSWGGRHHVGTISADGREATPLAVADPSRGALPLIEALARGEPMPQPSGARLAVEAITLRAPLPRPLRSLFCVGRNYGAHAAELADSVFRTSLPTEHTWPIVFTKLADCVVGPHDAVRMPGAAASTQIDYESELAVVIGRGGRDISRSRAMDHVFGYTVVNDVTARDVQVRHQQWDLGKSFDTFCPMGPWITTASELDGRATRVRGWGQRRAAPGGRHEGPDLRHPDADRDLLARHHALPRRRDRHRHAVGRRHGLQAAEVVGRGRRRADRDRRHRRHREPVRIGSCAMALHVFDRVVVEEEGEGDAVVCVHGLGGSSNTFTPLMPALARHRVIRVDLPGSARSSRVEGPLTVERFVETLLSVCNRLGVTRAHWIGHSLGTIVCQHLAVAAPKLVRSVTLFGPLIAPPEPARVAIRARAAKARSEGVAGMHEIALGLVNAALSADTRQRSPLAVAFVRESLMRQDSDGYARTCDALAEAIAAAVERIEAPVLLVTGDEDGVAPPQSVRAFAEKLHAAKSTRVVVLPRCGHWTPIERPEECGRELREFLGTQR